MKKKTQILSLTLAVALATAGLTGCGSDGGASSEASNSVEASQAESTSVPEESGEETPSESADAADGEWEYKEATLSLMIDNNVSLDGLNAVLELAKEKLGISVEIEYKVDDSVLKTRLAAGEMTDLMVYNSGSLLAALDPSKYLMDLSDQAFVDKYDDTYKASVTVDGVVYGVPFASTQAGAVMYYKPIYEELKLEVPTTWDEFISNCEKIEEAGYVAYIGTTSKKFTNQMIFLGDHYNLVSENPTFVSEFEKGNAKYATDPVAIKSFLKYDDIVPFMQEGHTAATYDDGCEMLAEGKGAHWTCLTQVLSNIYSLYGEEAVNNIGVFGVPGDDPDNQGLTVWMPNSLYGNINSDKQDDILRFMEFYISDEALDAYAGAILPDGPYCIKGYSLPDNSYDAVKVDMQAYFDAGKTKVAMEFETAVKGANCATICQSMICGEITAQEAAEQYDEDCKLQAIQLGLDWK